MTECPGSCNATLRRARRDYRQAMAEYNRAYPKWVEEGSPEDEPELPQEPDIEPVEGEPTWCSRCRATIRRCLANLDDLAAIRAAQADGHRGTLTDEKVTGSRGKPSPSPATDDLEELWSVLHGWETAYRGEDPRIRDKRLPVAIMTAVSWLVFHLDVILRHSIAEDFGKDILRWHAELSRKTTMDEVRRKPVPCPRCDLMALVQRPDEEYIACEQCGRLVLSDEYEELALQSARKITEASDA